MGPRVAVALVALVALLVPCAMAGAWVPQATLTLFHFLRLKTGVVGLSSDAIVVRVTALRPSSKLGATLW
jgi:hypothetical protein